MREQLEENERTIGRKWENNNERTFGRKWENNWKKMTK